jgi:hypothetical protein
MSEVAETVLHDADDIQADASALRASLAGRERELRQARLDVLSARDYAVGAQAEVGELRAVLKALKAEHEIMSDAFRAATAQLSMLLAEVEELRTLARHREAMLASETWRIGQAMTRPIRRVGRAIGSSRRS